VVAKVVRRNKLLEFFASLPTCLEQPAQTTAAIVAFIVKE
jgi:hypothetical protein